MSYEIKLTPSFKKSFKKLDFITQRTISKWIIKNLEATDNPRLHGKALSGNDYMFYHADDARAVVTVDRVLYASRSEDALLK